ncbi:hypothetical protein [Parvularcula sp. LCG005]|uniref:hypothetical protein n=1 Tax=Parvularcula sp. LCG005 TaxID=3078805 RepID=UPI002941EFFC|nr:hypothetical protein [Parvularcula sp. LCG005]WOI52989.1 hypothetical protein RUI03_12605 [Parvularcula sp. LCG005]
MTRTFTLSRHMWGVVFWLIENEQSSTEEMLEMAHRLASENTYGFEFEEALRLYFSEIVLKLLRVAQEETGEDIDAIAYDKYRPLD